MRMVRALALLVMTTTTFLSQASPAPEDLQQLRISVTDAMMGFYMYSGFEADEKYARRLDLDMADAYLALKDVNDSIETAEESAMNKELLAQWDAFNDHMNENRNDIVTRGYPNVRLVDEMGDACLNLTNTVKRFYDLALTSPQHNTTLVIQLIHDISFQMTDITAQYTGRGTSNLGQVFLGYHTSTPNEMAEKFEEYLEKLEEAVRQEDKLEIKGIRSKWGFLSRSISNYNENSVPFLVVIYNDSIIDTLDELAAKYH